MNIKHVLGDLSSAAEGTEVLVKLSSRRYWATITDLLEWQPPKRRRKNKDTGLCEQAPLSSAKKKKASKGSVRKTKVSKSSASKNSTASKCSANAANKLLWLRSESPAKSAGKAEEESSSE